MSGEDEKRNLERIREQRAYLYSLTGDASQVLAFLENDSGSLWDAYLKQEAGDRDLSDEVANWIMNALRRAFPERTLNDHTDVLIRMRHLVWMRLGQLDRDPDALDAKGD